MRRDKLEKLLKNDPDIEYVTPQRPMSSTLGVSAATIDAYAAWNTGYDGKGIGVAIVDSGIADTTDLNGTNGATRVVYGESFLDSDPKNPKDAFGHGTHVAGIVGGNGAGSNGKYKGIAPGVNLIDLRVLDQNGQGTDTAVIAAIDRAIELKNQYNI